MAKKTDPFDKFREATLSGAPPAAKKSKNANRKLVSFHIDNDIFLKLGQLKFEMGTKYEDLCNEAVRDLLVKYGML